MHTKKRKKTIGPLHNDQQLAPDGPRPPLVTTPGQQERFSNSDAFMKETMHKYYCRSVQLENQIMGFQPDKSPIARQWLQKGTDKKSATIRYN
jgi:hypothetical protein